ncbi:hypothetical protein [Arcticibacter sp. MXS-1]|uniref:hypothetical protein n=1 Tax=Arcticibacter sp. MXS-1 TaxID=3341726 RepID=UPI0035A96FF8
MLAPTLIFAIVFVLPLLAFYFYVALRDRNKNRMAGIAVIVALFILGAIIAYFVNRGKGG